MKNSAIKLQRVAWLYLGIVAGLAEACLSAFFGCPLPHSTPGSKLETMLALIYELSKENKGPNGNRYLNSQLFWWSCVVEGHFRWHVLPLDVLLGNRVNNWQRWEHEVGRLSPSDQSYLG